MTFKSSSRGEGFYQRAFALPVSLHLRFDGLEWKSAGCPCSKMLIHINSHDVKIRYIPGKDPAMVFLNADNKVVLEEDVSEKKKEEISQLLETHGLLKSAEARSEVPEDPYEEQPEPDEPWDEEEDREGEEDEEDEEGAEGEEEENEDDDDATEHIEL